MLLHISKHKFRLLFYNIKKVKATCFREKYKKLCKNVWKLYIFYHKFFSETYGYFIKKVVY